MSDFNGETPSFNDVFPNFTENIPTVAMRSQNIDLIEKSRLGFPVIVKSDTNNGSTVFNAIADGLETENLTLSDIQFFCLDDEEHMLNTFAIGLRKRMAQDGLVSAEADWEDGQLKIATENLHTANNTIDFVKNLTSIIESNNEIDLRKIYIALDHSLAGDVIDGFQLALILQTVFTNPTKTNPDRFINNMIPKVNILGGSTNTMATAVLPELFSTLLKVPYTENESGIDLRSLYVERLKQVGKQLEFLNRYKPRSKSGIESES